MGYHTEFWGEFEIIPTPTKEHREYIQRFSTTRRMKRDVTRALSLPDPVRLAALLPIGVEAGYFVGGDDFRGQAKDVSVLDYNEPPAGQPGLWCQWIIEDEAPGVLQWDGGEKFYNYIEWLEYIIDHFLGPWGYSLAGEVRWDGEEDGDEGKIVIKSPSNEVEVYERPDIWTLVRR